MMKRAVRVVIVFALLLLVAAIGARFYLKSRVVADKVVTQLESLYGGQVKVAGVDIGLKGSTLSGFELLEKDGVTPWLTVAELSTDISVFDVVRGDDVPKHVHINGAKILLRLDREGKLLTSLPEQLSKSDHEGTIGVLPEIDIKSSQITFRKEGAADLVLDDVHTKLHKENKEYILQGEAKNPQWGTWTLASQFSEGGQHLPLDIKSGGAVHLTAGMLQQVPFVPANVWREVPISRGDTPVELKLAYDLAAKTMHYQVDLEPVHTDLEVPSVALVATDAHGKVRIADQLVTLRGVAGNVLSGNLQTDADLDFRPDRSVLDFTRIDVAGLEVSSFPPSWKFPVQISGRLKGKASVQVVLTHVIPPAGVADIVALQGGPLADLPVRLAALAQPTENHVHTKGRGNGVIVNARVAGQPTAEPIEIELHPAAGGFQFRSAKQETRRPVPPSKLITADSLVFMVRSLTLLQPVQNRKVAAQKDVPAVLDIHLKMNDVDLGKFEQDMNVKLPFPMSGKVSFDAKVAIPLDNPRDLTKYRVQGTAQLNRLVVGDLKIETAETRIDFLNGVLGMATLQGRMFPQADAADKSAGTFQGTAKLQLEPLGNLEMKLSVERLPVEPLARLVGASERIVGEVSGTMQGVVPGKSLTDPTTWQATAQLTSRALSAAGMTIRSLAARLNLTKGELALTDLQGDLEGAPMSGSGKVQLAGNVPFAATLELKDLDLATLERLDPKLRPSIAVTGKLQTRAALKGTASPFALEGSGSTQASELTVGRLTFTRVDVGWILGADRLTIKDVRAGVGDGEITGSAVVPFQAAGAGAFNLQAKNVDVAALARALPALPVQIAGRVNGTLKADLPPTAPDKERMLQGNLDLHAPSLRVQHVPATNVQVTLATKNGLLDYRVVGEVLAGSLEVSGQAAAPTSGALAVQAVKVKKGHVHIKGVQLQRLVQAVGTPGAPTPIHGQLDVDLDFAPGKDGEPTGTGQVRLANLRYQDMRFMNAVGGELILSGHQLRLRNLAAELGQGSLRAQAFLDFKRMDQSRISLNIDGVQAEQLLKPWLGDKIKGPLTARVRLKLGREWTGSADVALDVGEVMGLQVTQWRVPIVFAYAPAAGRGELTVAETTAQVGNGRAHGKVHLSWGYTMQLDGELRLDRARVQSFLRQTVGSTQLGGGLMTARFVFAGRDMRSLDDLTGTLVASFEQTQALGVPLVGEIVPFLGMGPSTTFQKGDLRARLQNGVLHIQGLTLEGASYQLFIDGTVSLQGRLNLEVIANSGNFGIGTPRLRLLGVRIPLTGAVPVLFIQQAASLLANRVLHAHVSGTVHNPVVHLAPLITLSQEAARYFLTRSLNPTSSPFIP